MVRLTIKQSPISTISSDSWWSSCTCMTPTYTGRGKLPGENVGGASIPTGQPTDYIIAGGPYRFSRNPIYLGMVLLQIRVGDWSNSLGFIGLVALSVVLLNWGVISREERYLARKFGQPYLAYKERVRRWC